MLTWVKNQKKHNVCKKDYTWNPATCTYENCKHVGRITDNSVITSDKIIEAKKTVPTKSTSTKTTPKNFNEKKCNLLNKKVLSFT